MVEWGSAWYAINLVLGVAMMRHLSIVLIQQNIEWEADMLALFLFVTIQIENKTMKLN